MDFLADYAENIDASFFSFFLSLDQWLLVMSTQLIGFSIGGIARRFLVQPPSMSTYISIKSEYRLSYARN